jgi:hypothetical protein
MEAGNDYDELPAFPRQYPLDGSEIARSVATIHQSLLQTKSHIQVERMDRAPYRNKEKERVGVFSTERKAAMKPCSHRFIHCAADHGGLNPRVICDLCGESPPGLKAVYIPTTRGFYFEIVNERKAKMERNFDCELKKVDLPLLREQRNVLLEMQGNRDKDDAEYKTISGVINLLDAIVDAIIEQNTGPQDIPF